MTKIFAIAIITMVALRNLTLAHTVGMTEAAVASRFATLQTQGALETVRELKCDPVSVADGLVAPNFSLFDLQGQKVSLESLHGKVVLLNFWATWCPYCVEEMPSMEQLQREFGKQGLVVIGINVEDAPTARAFMKQHGYTFTTVVDADNDVGTLYQVDALPSVFIIGRDGKLVRRFVGASSKTLLRRAIARAGITSSSDV